MKRGVVLAAVALLAISFVAVSSIVGGWTAFLGTWVNVDCNTGGCTRFVISGMGPDSLVFQGYGACHPTDCTWSPAELVVYADSVSDTQAFYASWISNEGFAVSIGTLRFQGPCLVLTLYTRFVDGSGRSNYMTTDTFRRM
ncbi:MAG: hypothetical protein ABFD77_10350 [Thermotogota bacterium]